MSRYIEVNTSIEGKELNLRCRKFVVKLPRLCPIHNCRLFVFDLKINAEASIYTSYNPLKYKFNPNSKLSVNDTILGKKISGYSMQTVPDRVVAPHSGRHQAQYTKTHDDSLAVIIYQRQ